jgi:exosome complex RNA-binding protein Rrp4
MNTTKYLNHQVNDLVIGTVVGKNAEFFTVDINSDSHAILPVLEFMGSTRRDKPNWQEGTLVFCRVLEANSSSGLARTKLSCISPICKKSWNSGEAFFGEL